VDVKQIHTLYINKTGIIGIKYIHTLYINKTEVEMIQYKSEAILLELHGIFQLIVHLCRTKTTMGKDEMIRN